ncbi:MAG: hypothetical protein ACRER9_08975, partial [Gammaproteobacteria bacterium]
MNDSATLEDLEQHGEFIGRHIGPDEAEQQAMLRELGFATRAALANAAVPVNIRRHDGLPLGPFSEPKS